MCDDMERRKIQFSKLHVVFADCLVAFVYATNFILAWHDKQPISDIAVAIITIFGAFATGGYFTLCAVRDTSLNKLEGIKAQYHHDDD